VTGRTVLVTDAGMGVDEGMMIVGNEMARVAALVAAREHSAAMSSAGSAA
jgi:methylaspartate ammonia-lyase